VTVDLQLPAAQVRRLPSVADPTSGVLADDFSNLLLPWRGRLGANLAPPLRNRWFADSPLEGDGFEPKVPATARPVEGVTAGAVQYQVADHEIDAFRHDRKFA